MKSLFFNLLFAISFVCSSYSQQQPQIVISRDTLRKEGILFHRHKVEKGQTIFSLCRVYGVEAEQLLRDNPELSNGLREGALLMIRKAETITRKYIKYTVKWFDNLQSISDQFGVSPGEIIALNSLSEPKVKTRQELLIPYKENLSKKDNLTLSGTPLPEMESSKEKRDASEEEAKKLAAAKREADKEKDAREKAEKLEAVRQESARQDAARQEAAHQEALRKETARLEKARQKAQRQEEKRKEALENETIRQEAEKQTTSLTENKVETAVLKSVTEETNPKVQLTTLPDKNDNIAENIAPPERGLERSAKIALILPFGQQENTNNYSGNNYVDFYQGFLLAAQEMKDAGMSLDLNVLDIKEYPSGRVLYQSGVLEKSDLIIGPVFRDEVAEVLEYASENDIPIVSPMDPSTEDLAKYNPLFFQIGISTYIQQLNLLKALSRNSQVTLIFEESGADSALVSTSKDILNQLGIRYSSLSYNVLSGREIGPRMISRLSDSKLNEIVVISNSEAFVSDVLRNLNLLCSRNNYKISLYGTPRWRNFDNVDVTYYHSMNLHLSLQYYVDYESEEVKNFMDSYSSYFSGDPSPYSFQGYDLGKFFLKNIFRYGPRFVKRVEGYREELLQSDLMLEKVGQGFVNNATRLIIYNPDFSVQIRRFVR